MRKTAPEWHKSGKKHLKHNALKQALHAFQNACAQDKRSEEYRINLGKTAIKMGQYEIAFQAFHHACHLAPSNETYKILLGKACSGLKINKFDHKVKEALLLCLHTKNIEHQTLAPLWFENLQHDKKLRMLFDENIDTLNISDPYVLLGLQCFFTTNPQMEKWLTGLRHNLLKEITINQNFKAIELAASLAQHCFLNEYSFAASPTEDKIIQDLHKDIEAGNNTENTLIAYAMYCSLGNLKTADALSPETLSPHTQSLITQQITEIEEERTYAQNIETISAIKEKTSQNVQNMYEQNPYPRWHAVSAISNPISCDTLSYLIAGCGTGRSACQTALFLPDTAITAIDLSLTSLSYAKRKAAALNLDHITFLQGDILDAEKLNKTFDIIECSGVLHHMKEPLSGWRALCGALSEGGRMNIGLYSRKARKHIIAAQNYAKEQGYTGTEDVLPSEDNPSRDL